MADRLRDAGKNVQLTLYPKLDHYLEDANTRADMLGSGPINRIPMAARM